jgi:hypothetical protein
MNVGLRSDSRWVETALLSALDPSHLTLLAAVPDGTTLPADLKASVPESHFLEIAADAERRGAVRNDFWQRRRRCPGAHGRPCGLDEPDLVSCGPFGCLPPQMV